MEQLCETLNLRDELSLYLLITQFNEVNQPLWKKHHALHTYTVFNSPSVCLLVLRVSLLNDLAV